MTAKRHDRYCTEITAGDVLAYMMANAEYMVTLFQIRGANRARFKSQLIDLKPLTGRALRDALHGLCEQWDRSKTEDYSKFRARLRRFRLLQSKGQAITVSEKTKKRLQEFIEREGLVSADEAVSQLLADWDFNSTEN